MRAQVRGVELDYEVLGDGPELVWLHGLSGSLEESRPLCEALARDFRVLWYSSRGHGASTCLPSRAGYDYDEFADDLQALLDHVGFTRPVVGGGSHGANTALRYAVRHPGRARALLLVAHGANALRRPKRLMWALVRAHVDLEVMRAHALRTLHSVTSGTSGTESSVAKLLWSHWHRNLGELAMQVRGAASMLEQGTDDPQTPAQHGSIALSALFQISSEGGE